MSDIQPSPNPPPNGIVYIIPGPRHNIHQALKIVASFSDHDSQRAALWSLVEKEVLSYEWYMHVEVKDATTSGYPMLHFLLNTAQYLDIPNILLDKTIIAAAYTPSEYVDYLLTLPEVENNSDLRDQIDLLQVWYHSELTLQSIENISKDDTSAYTLHDIIGLIKVFEPCEATVNQMYIQKAIRRIFYSDVSSCDDSYKQCGPPSVKFWCSLLTIWNMEDPKLSEYIEDCSVHNVLSLYGYINRYIGDIEQLERIYTHSTKELKMISRTIYSPRPVDILLTVEHNTSIIEDSHGNIYRICFLKDLMYIFDLFSPSHHEAVFKFLTGPDGTFTSLICETMSLDVIRALTYIWPNLKMQFQYSSAFRKVSGSYITSNNPFSYEDLKEYLPFIKSLTDLDGTNQRRYQYSFTTRHCAKVVIETVEYNLYIKKMKRNEIANVISKNHEMIETRDKTVDPRHRCFICTCYAEPHDTFVAFSIANDPNILVALALAKQQHQITRSATDTDTEVDSPTEKETTSKPSPIPHEIHAVHAECAEAMIINFKLQEKDLYGSCPCCTEILDFSSSIPVKVNAELHVPMATPPIVDSNLLKKKKRTKRRRKNSPITSLNLKGKRPRFGDSDVTE
jgi:hypothetical protein